MGGVNIVKFMVSKKGVRPLLIPLILYNSIFVVSFILALLDAKEDVIARIIAIIMIILFLVNTITAIYLLIPCIVTVSFDKDEVKCSLMKKVTQRIPYNKIKDYGEVWIRGVKYIYLSETGLSDSQKENKLFDLYKKHNNVIVMQFQKEALSLLNERITECQNTNQ